MVTRLKVKLSSHQHAQNHCPNQIWTSCTVRYSLDKMLKVKVITARLKVQLRSYYNVTYLQPLTNVTTKWISYTLQFSKYVQDKIFKVKVITARPKIKSWSHYDSEHLYPLTNVPSKNAHPALYSFWNYNSMGKIFLSPKLPPIWIMDAKGESNTSKPFSGCGVKGTLDLLRYFLEYLYLAKSSFIMPSCP